MVNGYKNQTTLVKHVRQTVKHVPKLLNVYHAQMVNGQTQILFHVMLTRKNAKKTNSMFRQIIHVLTVEKTALHVQMPLNVKHVQKVNGIMLEIVMQTKQNAPQLNSSSKQTIPVKTVQQHVDHVPMIQNVIHVQILLNGFHQTENVMM